MKLTDGPIALDLRREGGEAGSARTLVSAIYSRVRADILSCRYPPGEKLLIGPLSERFDVSIASVREALFRLVADGLVLGVKDTGDGGFGVALVASLARDLRYTYANGKNRLLLTVRSQAFQA